MRFKAKIVQDKLLVFAGRGIYSVTIKAVPYQLESSMNPCGMCEGGKMKKKS